METDWINVLTSITETNKTTVWMKNVKYIQSKRKSVAANLKVREEQGKSMSWTEWTISIQSYWRSL